MATGDLSKFKGATADFDGAGAVLGIEVWRIKNFAACRNGERLTEDAATAIGLDTGDSYLILRTYENRYRRRSLDLFFWIGKESTQDERAAAAFWTVNLDDKLNGKPVQYREVEGHESQQFLSIWRGGLQYLSGGVDSGFRKVDRSAFNTQLLHLKGARFVRVSSVLVSAESMNHGDAFILDTGRIIYLWQGAESSRREKIKAIQVASSLRGEGGRGTSSLVYVEDGAETDDFWTALGGRGTIKSAAEGGDDDEVETHTAPSLWLVSDTSGSLKVTKVKTGGLTRTMLDTDDCFIVETGPRGGSIFAWVGRGATAQERRGVMQHALAFISQQKYPEWTRVQNMSEGTETALFKQQFRVWREPKAAVDFSRATTEPKSTLAKGPSADTLDIASLSVRATPPDEEALDDGSGTLQVWCIRRGEPTPVPKEKHGEFFAGDSYILQYDYASATGRPKTHIFFWLGRLSSQDERTAAAYHTVKMDCALGGRAVQVRVVQGKEPSAFCSLFKGTMIIHYGGHASMLISAKDFTAIETADKLQPDPVSLYHVRGTTTLNTRASCVAAKASSFNSGDAFVVVLEDKLYVWMGSGCNACERSAATSAAAHLAKGRPVTELTEGNEPDAFWAFLGGKADYPCEALSDERARDPRLFCISDGTGALKVEEIVNFAQSDLDTDDVFLLDLWICMLVWIGDACTEQERKAGPTLALRHAAATGRTDIPISTVQPGAEPALFCSCFLGWDESLAQALIDSLELQKRLAAGSTTDARALIEAGKRPDDFVGYTADELQQHLGADTLPAWISRADLPSALRADQFQALFGKSREVFYSQPRWRQVGDKKKASLF